MTGQLPHERFTSNKIWNYVIWNIFSSFIFYILSLFSPFEFAISRLFSLLYRTRNWLWSKLCRKTFSFPNIIYRHGNNLRRIQFLTCILHLSPPKHTASLSTLIFCFFSQAFPFLAFNFLLIAGITYIDLTKKFTFFSP